jgi:hypothetical protein
MRLDEGGFHSEDLDIFNFNNLFRNLCPFFVYQDKYNA